ncbi:MAG: hypothetical protein DRR08_18480 [Candidatus Parabeggiatoa sp. nov. 2]|nr:MAG: hypothetical protein B6247_29740 [Beggiatoa sp. 4572_84]RKZ57647.1 MAG: hypothetical protein DRR08_18480 [Gammaproteobacteria bacterium]
MIQQFTLDDPRLETALSSIAQQEGKEITDVIMNAIAYFVKQKYSQHFNKFKASLPENQALNDDNSLESQISQMAYDPQIQRELKQIEQEFSQMEGVKWLGEDRVHN